MHTCISSLLLARVAYTGHCILSAQIAGRWYSSNNAPEIVLDLQVVQHHTPWGRVVYTLHGQMVLHVRSRQLRPTRARGAVNSQSLLNGIDVCVLCTRSLRVSFLLCHSKLCARRVSFRGSISIRATTRPWGTPCVKYCCIWSTRTRQRSRASSENSRKSEQLTSAVSGPHISVKEIGQ